MNRRISQRIEVQNVVANLSNAKDSFAATVNDVSRDGILLSDIPISIQDKSEQLSIVVSANNTDYKMVVIPKWINEINSQKRMGLEIIDAPLDWVLFVMDYHPMDENIWAATTNVPDC
ncbi:PilZ domain-containing protein [Desulforhopalus sp. 52FAK]